MYNNITELGQRIMAAVAGIAGLLAIIVVPELAMKVANLVAKNASMAMDMLNRPNIIAAPKLVSLLYPIWSGLGVVAGVVLLLSVLPIARGEKWGRPAALGSLFFLSVFGMYAIWPVTFFARLMFGEISFGQISFFAKELLINPLSIFLIGIIPFFVILLSKKATFKNKLTEFALYLSLILTTGLSFMTGHTALRALWSSLIDKPQIIDKALSVGTVTNWVAVIIIIIAIPALAAGMKKGWLMSLVGSSAAIMGNGILIVGHLDTADYKVGLVLALVAFLLLNLPVVKEKLAENS
ncbi:MAG: hypothetical protein WDA53_02610 [Bacillota bacterium]